VLTGYAIQFSEPLDAAAAANRANYEVDRLTTRKVKKVVQRVLHPIHNFTVSYSPADDTVMLKLGGKQTFPTGGQITVLSGVASGSGGSLKGATAFSIAKGGKKITAQ
jgi:hypothetical protein